MTTLGEIAELSRERVLPAEVPAMPYIGLEHIEPQTMKLLSHGYGRDARSSSVQFSKGDVLYGKMRPYLNKVWVAEFDGICSAEFLVFQKHSRLNNQFLAMRLNAEDFVAFANGQVSGERPRVDFEKLSPFSILLPPIAEQERIVAKLTVAFSKVERAETAASRARERLKRYHDAVLHTAVTGELTRSWREAKQKNRKANAETGEDLLQRLLSMRRTRWEEAELQRLLTAGKEPKNEKWKSRCPQPTLPKTDGLPKLPESWTWASIEQLSWASGYGTSVKCTYEASGPAVLRIPNVRSRSLDFEDLKYATNSKDFDEEDFVTPGDLLLIRTNGSIDLIGRVAIVKTPPKKKCSFASYLIRFRLVGDEIIWSWISIAWDSDMLRSNLESRAVTTAGQYNLSLSRLEDLAIPLPPTEEITEIAHEVEHRLYAADQLDSRLKRQLERSQTTRQSLLREAFAGRLVPRDPNDEPASALLAGIHSAREAEAKKPRSKRMPKTNIKSKAHRRPLLDVLREHKKPMTPEQLFVDSGYQQEFKDNDYRQEVVEKFYEELWQLVGPKGPVLEKRPNRNKVLLEVQS